MSPHIKAGRAAHFISAFGENLNGTNSMSSVLGIGTAVSSLESSNSVASNARISGFTYVLQVPALDSGTYVSSGGLSTRTSELTLVPTVPTLELRNLG